MHSENDIFFLSYNLIYKNTSLYEPHDPNIIVNDSSCIFKITYIYFRSFMYISIYFRGMTQNKKGGLLRVILDIKIIQNCKYLVIVVNIYLDWRMNPKMSQHSKINSHKTCIWSNQN